MLARLGREIEHLDTRLVETRREASCPLLATIPGIGVIIAYDCAGCW